MAYCRLVGEEGHMDLACSHLKSKPIVCMHFLHKRTIPSTGDKHSMGRVKIDSLPA